MEVQLFKTDSRDALLSLYMFFLKKQGFNVTYENKGGKMRGGAWLDEPVYAIFLAFVFFIAINIKFPQNSAELHKALNEAATNPASVVTDLIKNNKEQLLQAEDIIEDFGVHRVHEIEYDITHTMDNIFQKNTKEAIMHGVISVAANAMRKIEIDAMRKIEMNTMNSKFGDLYDDNTVVEGTTFLEKYIVEHDKANRPTNEIDNFSKVPSTVSAEKPVTSSAANKIGGSKTRGQKRKIVESKRKRGGSKKQKRRSHKRK